MAKKIELRVVIEVPDDYVMDEPLWTLEECFTEFGSPCELTSVGVIKT